MKSAFIVHRSSFIILSMNILVFGAGAVGRYIGGHLAHAGHHVTLITRSGAERIRRQGLTIKKKRGDLFVQPNASPSLRQAIQTADEEGRKYDLMLLTMKSYDVEGATNEIVAFYEQPPPIITLQNGINAERPLFEQFGNARVVPGSLTTPVSFDANFNVVEERANRGIGLSTFGSEGNKLSKQGQKLFKKAGIKTIMVKNYESLKWSKGLINMVGNATSAIINRRPSVLYRSNAIYKLEMRMLKEVLKIMNRLNIEVINLPGTPARTLKYGINSLSDRWLQPILTYQMKRGRGSKMPSFQIDLASGKENNEVFYHNGAVARIGREIGIATPVNAALNDILLDIATQKIDWDRFDGMPKELLTTVNRYIREARVNNQ